MSFAIRESSVAKGSPVNLYLFRGSDDTAGVLGPFAFTDAEQPIVRAGVTYQPAAITDNGVEASGTGDKVLFKVTIAQGSALDQFFLYRQPEQVLNLIVYAGHHGDSTANLTDWPARWNGRALGGVFNDRDLEIQCEPLLSSLRRPGLRRNYQKFCPHALYGPDCRADRSRATIVRSATAVSGQNITLSSALPTSPARTKYVGGLAEWTPPGGGKIVRTITNVNAAGTSITVRGYLPPTMLQSGTSVSLLLGCGHTTADCSALHANILNYGGQPLMPDDSPLTAKNNFY